MNLTRRALGVSLLAQGGGSFAATNQQDPEKLIWSLGRIEWQREEYGGARYAVIDGDRDKPGQPFTYAFWMPSGLWVPAHEHTQQAHVAVLAGELLLGFGRKMDRKKHQTIPAGGFFIVRAGVAHYEGCEKETLIIGSALGGWKTKTLE